MYCIYGERYTKYSPIVDNRTKEILDDGVPKKVKLGTWSDKKTADVMAANIKATVPKRSWNIWVEESN